MKLSNVFFKEYIFNELQSNIGDIKTRGTIFITYKSMSKSVIRQSDIPQQPQHGGLQQLGHLAKLMDAQFRVPGTNFRFGLDGIIGLIPGAGDLSTFAVSGYMLWIMAHNGASGFVLARMVINVLIDALVGSIPLIGDIFDIAFKANMRNLRLMQEHYSEGRHKGSAWKAIVPVLIVLFLIIAAIIYGTYKLLAMIFNSW